MWEITDAVCHFEHCRMVVPVRFGLAVYEGYMDGDVFKGIHRGVVETHVDAFRWLNKEVPDKLTVVFDNV